MCVYPCGRLGLNFGHTTMSVVKAIVGLLGFDCRMLLLATSMAYESDMKNLLLTISKALLKTLKCRGGVEADMEAVTPVWCIVWLVHLLLDNKPHNGYALSGLVLVSKVKGPKNAFLFRHLMEYLVKYFGTGLVAFS